MTTGHTFNTDQTRAVFGNLFAKIIEDVIGDARIRELFDAAGKHPDEYEGKPTGMIAVKLGVITQGTNTALLIAQAAERTLRLAEKVQFLPSQGLADEESIVEYAKAHCIPSDDPVFKFVGSPRDPEILQQAQATWKIAQMNLNQEVKFLEEAVFLKSPPHIYQAHVGGLQKTAAELYATAADMLQSEGHTDAAEKLQAVSKSIQFEETYTPSAFKVATSMLERAQSDAQQKNHSMGDHRYSVDGEWSDEIIRLSKFAEPKDGKPSAPAPGAPTLER